MHRAIRQHYSSLVGAPGTTLPTAPDSIELLEELIYHTLQTGNVDEAREIYHHRLGGYQHLAWTLGQYSRCIRILTEFPRCPDQGGLIWCYRAVGDLDAAAAATDPDDTWWLCMIGCLRGHFYEVANKLKDSRQDPLRAVAEFPAGLGKLEALEHAPIWTGLPINGAECYLIANRDLAARDYVNRSLEELKNEARGATWNDEIARLDLVNAEIERRAGNYSGCHALLEKATQWIVQSGSQEHLCALHLGKARLAADKKEFEIAKIAVGEGLHIAQQCGFGYHFVLLQIQRAEIFIHFGDFLVALDAAMAARNGILKSTITPPAEPDAKPSALLVTGAAHPANRYVWGISRAGFSQGLALAKLERYAEAKSILAEISQLQTEIGASDGRDTVLLLASLPAGAPSSNVCIEGP
jgi:hypothetical protein